MGDYIFAEGMIVGDTVNNNPNWFYLRPGYVSAAYIQIDRAGVDWVWCRIPNHCDNVEK